MPVTTFPNDRSGAELLTRLVRRWSARCNPECCAYFYENGDNYHACIVISALTNSGVYVSFKNVTTEELVDYVARARGVDVDNIVWVIEKVSKLDCGDDDICARVKGVLRELAALIALLRPEYLKYLNH